MKSFNEILEEKLALTNKKNSNSYYFSSDNAYDLDLNPLDFSFFERRNSSSFAKKVGFTSYNVKERIIKPRPHALNVKQKHALNWFLSRGIELSEGFSKAELSQAFRKLAFALHPDYNRQREAQEIYQCLHENKEALMQVFQTNE
jgi:hypothetical protein